MKPLLLVLSIILPFFGISQGLELSLSPAGTAPANWQQDAIKVLKQRYFLLGLSPEEYDIRQQGSSIKVVFKKEEDPMVLKHLSESKGNFRLLGVHKLDDEAMRPLYQAIKSGNLRENGKIQAVTDYFKLNDYALAGHKYRRFPPAVIGMAAAEHIPLIDEFLRTSRIQGALPAKAKFYWARKANKLHPGMYDLYLADTSPENSLYIPRIENINIATKPNHYGRIRDVLQLKLTGEAKAHLRKVSIKNAQREVIALIDDQVLTAPVVEGPIETGELELEGNFQGKEAILIRRMVMDLKLPCQLKAIPFN